MSMMAVILAFTLEYHVTFWMDAVLRHCPYKLLHERNKLYCVNHCDFELPSYMHLSLILIWPRSDIAL
jgi:hypothetical protein